MQRVVSCWIFLRCSRRLRPNDQHAGINDPLNLSLVQQFLPFSLVM